MSGGGGSVPKPRKPLGPMGMTPRGDPKNRRDEFAPSCSKMRLSELFENNDWICRDGFVKRG